MMSELVEHETGDSEPVLTASRLGFAQFMLHFLTYFLFGKRGFQP